MKTIIAALSIGLFAYVLLVCAEKREHSQCAADDFSDMCVGADMDNRGDWQEVIK